MSFEGLIFLAKLLRVVGPEAVALYGDLREMFDAAELTDEQRAEIDEILEKDPEDFF